MIFADRDGEPFELTEVERSTMHALGRTAALASHVREVTRQLERGKRLSERIDLARDVHERVTQRLFGISMALGSDRPLAEGGSGALRRRDQGGNRRPPRGADRLRGEVGDGGSRGDPPV